MPRAIRQVLPIFLSVLGGAAIALLAAVACAWLAKPSMIWGYGFLNEHTGKGHRDFEAFARALPESERVVVMSSSGFGHHALDIRWYDAADLERTQYPPVKRRAFQTAIGWPHVAISTNSRTIGKRFAAAIGPNAPTDDAALDDGRPLAVRILWSGLCFDSLLFASVILGAWLAFRRSATFGAPRSLVAAACIGLWLAVLSAWACDLAPQMIPVWPRTHKGFCEPFIPPFGDLTSFSATVHAIDVPPSDAWDRFGGGETISFGYRYWYGSFSKMLPNNRMASAGGDGSLALGWPLSAFTGDGILPWHATGAALTDTRTRHLQGLLTLPVHWPGLIVNWIFFTIVTLALLRGPRAVRRWRRLRNGRCPECNYPMAASPVCTECGVALPPRAVSGQSLTR